MGWQKTFVVAFTAICVLTTAIGLLFQLLALRMPAFEELRRSSKGLTYLDRTGQPLSVAKRAGQNFRSQWVELNKIDSELVGALPDVSTLSVQLVKFFDGSDPLRTHHSWIQRSKARLLARALRLRWTDSQVVEAYLNLAYFRRDIRGIASAAFEIFEKTPQELSAKEVQTLVSLLKAPLGRRAAVRTHPGLSVPAFYEERARSRGFVFGSVPLTLDVKVHQQVGQSMKQYGGRRALASAVVLDNATGEILSAVGDIEKVHLGRFLLNPWLYALALDRGIVSMASWLHDAPLTVGYEHNFREKVLVREALEQSLSIPTVQILELMGADQYVDLLKILELRSLPSATLAGPSLVMEGPAVSLLEATNAYRAFANHGIYSSTRWQRSAESVRPSRVLSAAASFLIEDSLGQHAELSTEPLWTGVQHVSETDGEWCVGFSEKYTIGVWMPAKAGANIASRIWQGIVRDLHRGLPSAAPSVPQELVRREMKISSKKVKLEYFLPGTEFLRGRQIGFTEKSRIVFPVDQAVLSVESPSAAPRQKIFFQAHPANSEDVWVLNGQKLGPVREFTAWTPQAGAFELEIRDPGGHIVDSVRFKVGAPQTFSTPGLVKNHDL